MMYLAFMCALSIFSFLHTLPPSSPPLFSIRHLQPLWILFSCSRPYTYNASLCRSMLSFIISLSYHQFTHSHAQVFVFAFSIFLQALLYKVVVFCCHNNIFMFENVHRVVYLVH